MKTTARMLATLLIGSIVLPAGAQAPPKYPTPAPAGATPQANANGEEMQPKFLWGLLLNIVFKFAMSAFSDWLAQKVTTDVTDNSKLNKILLSSAHAAIVTLADESPFGVKSAGAVDNTTVGEPTEPLKVENGRENYQGVHVAIVAFDRAENALGVKPVNAGFRTGERIKLKVLPTFDGLLVIENINPKGERRQIYPPADGKVVATKAGEEIMVPLAKDEYFEFAGVTGDEQLVITIRDRRAFGTAASPVEVKRKDDASGSSFVQETPNGSFPVIAQTIRLKHGF